MKKPKLSSKLLDFLFPPRCILCNTIITSDTCLCRKCNDKVFMLDDIQMTTVKNENFLGNCLAPYLYEDRIQKLIIDFKFYQKPQYGKLLGEKLAQAFIVKEIAVNCEVVTCVPISKERLKQRGYNQAEMVAKCVAKQLGIPYKDCIVKIKHNKEQHKLHVEDRKENVKGVYDMAEMKHITNKKVLLVDDIVTTGYTLAECASLLMASGAKEVLCGAVACRPNVYLNDEDPFEEACKHCKI